MQRNLGTRLAFYLNLSSYSCLLLTFSLLLAQDAFALRGSPFKAFQVSYFGSGARPIAMGGAFVGLADDPTATDWNPAGCQIPLEPEVSLQYKHSFITYERINGGTIEPGNTRSIEYKEHDSSIPSLNYVGFIWPFQAVPLTLGINRFETVNYEEEWTSDGIVRGTGLNPAAINRIRSSASMMVEHYGLTIAGSPLPIFSLGATLRWSRFSYDVEGEQLDLTRPDRWSQSGSSDGFSFVVGALIKPSDRIGIGLVYRSSFDVEYIDTFIAPHQDDFTFPWSASLGVSFLPLPDNDRFTITVDLMFIRNSDLGKHLSNTRYLLDGTLADIDTAGWKTPDDAVQPHIGFEYALNAGAVIIPLRVGYYFEPNRTPYYEGDGQGIDPRGSLNTDAVVLFPQYDPVHHVTAGFGVTWEGLKVDVGANYFDGSVEAMLSVAYRFKRNS